MELNVITHRTKSVLYVMEAQLALIKEIHIEQVTNPQLEHTMKEILARKAPGFVIREDGNIRFHNLVCVPAVEELKKKILDKVTHSAFNTPRRK